MASMKRLLVLSVGLGALAFGVFVAWYTVRQEREFRRLIAAGDAALAREETYGAIEAFSGALALNRESMLAHLKRGDTYRRRGELESALRDLRQAATLDPAAPRPIELLGDVHAAMDRHETAADQYAAFIELDDRAPRVYYKLALARYRSGRGERAIDPLRQAVALDDRMAEAHYLLGLCLRDRREEAAALESLTRAVTINPAFAAAREELAALYEGADRRSQAIEQLEALAALEPTRPERLLGVGLAYARWGRLDAAVLTLGRAADRFPDDPLVYTALGRVWLQDAERRGDRAALGKALQALEPLAATAEAPSEALMLYGRALFLAGNHAAAERLLLRAAARAPVEPAVFQYLAEAAQLLGHTAEAQDARLRYVALVDDGDSTRP